MSRPVLEVADIFRGHGPAWRQANAGHVSLGQLKVMAAIEICRTAALGGHVARCENENCAYTQVAYNSCCNRHCPKCQGAAAREWLAEREAELLPVPYLHVVFSLPAQIADIAYHNKAVIYDILSGHCETARPRASQPSWHTDRHGYFVVMALSLSKGAHCLRVQVQVGLRHFGWRQDHPLIERRVPVPCPLRNPACSRSGLRSPFGPWVHGGFRRR
jgi:hypothetical protein